MKYVLLPNLFSFLNLTNSFLNLFSKLGVGSWSIIFDFSICSSIFWMASFSLITTNPVPLLNGYILMFLSCFILVSVFLSAKLRLFLCFFFKSLVIILPIFCRSDYTILNCPSCSKSNAQFSVIGIMSMYDLFLFSVGTNLGPKFRSLILFWSNSSSVRFTRLS